MTIFVINLLTSFDNLYVSTNLCFLANILFAQFSIATLKAVPTFCAIKLQQLCHKINSLPGLSCVGLSQSLKK